jgi:hypothetical protein
MVVEMWNDDALDSVQRARTARMFIEERLGQAGIRVWGTHRVGAGRAG